MEGAGFPLTEMDVIIASHSYYGVAKERWKDKVSEREREKEEEEERRRRREKGRKDWKGKEAWRRKAQRRGG